MTPDLRSAVTTLNLASQRLAEKANEAYGHYLQAYYENPEAAFEALTRSRAHAEDAEALREMAEALAPGLLARLGDEDAVAALLDELPDAPALSLIEGGS